MTTLHLLKYGPIERVRQLDSNSKIPREIRWYISEKCVEYVHNKVLSELSKLGKIERFFFRHFMLVRHRELKRLIRQSTPGYAIPQHLAITACILHLKELECLKNNIPISSWYDSPSGAAEQEITQVIIQLLLDYNEPE